MVVLTPHGTVRGSRASTRGVGGAPPLDLPSSPRSERVLGLQGRGRWSLPAESSPSCDTACSAASLVGTERKGPSAPASGAHRPNLGSLPTVQTLPCRWGALGDGGWLRLEGEEADGARCEGKTPSPPPRGRETAEDTAAQGGRVLTGGRPGFSTSLTWFMTQWPPLTRSVLPDPPPRRAWAPSSPRPGWDPARCCGWRGRARDPSASPCRLLPSEPHPSRPLTALPLLFWAASQKNGQA